MLGFILRGLIAALGLWLATEWVAGVRLDSAATLILAGLLLGVVNAFIRPLVLILTLPLTSETRGLIGRDVFGACRGAVLMNAGRGAVVDERIIPEALDKGWLAGAILDVFETEPLPTSSPLWDDKRVMISPHISGLTTPEGAVEGFLECLGEIEQGRVPARAVDRDREY